MRLRKRSISKRITPKENMSLAVLMHGSFPLGGEPTLYSNSGKLC
jgi:hypothetical protein